jgi:uncharacterized protein
MEFNKITRGANRAIEHEATVFEILDAGFMCHLSFIFNNTPQIVATAYGRDGHILYLHGSAKNWHLNEIIKQDEICISVTYLDGIVLARSLFDTGVNYRSVVLHGKAVLVTEEAERLHALEVFTNQVMPGRWQEVPVGNAQQLKGTMVVKFEIEKASCKLRNEGPKGDEHLTNIVWSGHIPLQQITLTPIADSKFETQPLSESVKNYIKKHSSLEK